MKRTYEAPEIKIIEFTVSSIILASVETELPEVPDTFSIDPSKSIQINSTGFGW